MPYQSSQTSPVEKRGSGCCDQSFASVILACMGPFYVLRFGWFWCFFCWWLVGGGGGSPHPQRFKDFSLCKRWPRKDVVLSYFFTFRITSSKFRAPWFGGSKVLALQEADTLLAYVSLLTFGPLVLNYTRHRNQWMLLFLTACSSIENQELDCWGKSSKSLCVGGCSYRCFP